MVCHALEAWGATRPPIPTWRSCHCLLLRVRDGLWSTGISPILSNSSRPSPRGRPSSIPQKRCTCEPTRPRPREPTQWTWLATTRFRFRMVRHSHPSLTETARTTVLTAVATLPTVIITTTPILTPIPTVASAPPPPLDRCPSRLSPSLPVTALGVVPVRHLLLHQRIPVATLGLVRARPPNPPQSLLSAVLLTERRTEPLRRRSAGERDLFCRSSESKPAR